MSRKKKENAKKRKASKINENHKITTKTNY